MRTILRILVLVAPPCAAGLTCLICARLQSRKAAEAATASTANSADGAIEIAVADTENEFILPVGQGDGN